MSNYVEFATLYDELMNDFDYENWSNYIEEIFNRNEVKPHKLLEMACGTGSLSYYLAKKRYDLVCFDLSSDMLSKAYEKLGKFKNVKLLKQDMINFNINQKFDSVISICDSINYIVDKNDLVKSFKNVYNHLNENGIFIFDINSFYKLKEIIGNNTFIEDREDVFYTWQNYYNEDTNICEFFLTFFKSDKNDLYYRFDEEHTERAYKVDEIIECLNKAGFGNVNYYNGFTFDDVTETSERINFVVTK